MLRYTVVGRGVKCIDDAVTAYLVDLTVPAPARPAPRNPRIWDSECGPGTKEAASIQTAPPASQGLSCAGFGVDSIWLGGGGVIRTGVPKSV